MRAATTRHPTKISKGLVVPPPAKYQAIRLPALRCLADVSQCFYRMPIHAEEVSISQFKVYNHATYAAASKHCFGVPEVQ